ncbi:glycosyltransferase [Halocola ammonii]
MKVLQLCHKPPFPAVDGGCIAMENITRGLIEQGCDVKLLTISTHKHRLELENVPKDILEKTKIEGVFVDTRVNIVDAFSSLITQDSYNISRFFSTDFDIKLTELLQEESFDVIHLESLFMTPYIGTIRRSSNAKIVLRSHNLEYIIWDRIARGTRSIAKKAYLRYLSRKLKKYELDVMEQVDGIATISDEDLKRYKKLGFEKSMVNIPFGIDFNNYVCPVDNKPRLALFHLGSMNWMPNLEGVLWFLEDIWPTIHEKFPELELHLAGREMPDDLMDEPQPNVHIIGEVEDAKKFICSNAIMIVPLLSAGGIRVKIIEGMALGRAIISTSVGAEGIDCKNGEDIMIASNAKQFVAAIQKFVDNPELAAQMGERARELVSKKYDNHKLSAELVEFYKSLSA